MLHDLTALVAGYAGKPLAVELGGKDFVLHKVHGDFVVFSRWCPHARGDLLKARFSVDSLTCMNHGLCFSLPGGNIDLSALDEEIIGQLNESGSRLDALRMSVVRVDQLHGVYLVEL